MLPFTKEQLEKSINDGYVKRQKHPHTDFYIYNYTPKAQFDGHWNDVTLNCRGLILDGDYNIIARPFKKFFNYHEYLNNPEKLGQIPKEKPILMEKYDGSLGILYWIGNKPQIATRGSFTSDQAIYATNLLKDKYSHCIDSLMEYKNVETILFEIIYPENRIVLDYNKQSTLIQLSMLDIKTGKTVRNKFLGFPRAKVEVDANKFSYDQIQKLDIKNKEGYVCYFPSSDFRMKLKFNEYVRLHKILTTVSEKSIWEYLKNGYNLEDLIKDVPDEFYNWVRMISHKLNGDYFKLEAKTQYHFSMIDGDLSNTIFKNEVEKRKEFANQVSKLDSELRAILFRMYDDKDYSDIIWNILKPKTEQSFKVNLEDNK